MGQKPRLRVLGAAPKRRPRQYVRAVRLLIGSVAFPQGWLDSCAGATRSLLRVIATEATRRFKQSSRSGSRTHWRRLVRLQYVAGPPGISSRFPWLTRQKASSLMYGYGDFHGPGLQASVDDFGRRTGGTGASLVGARGAGKARKPAYPLGPRFAGPRQGLARVAPPPSIPWTPALRQAMARTRPAGRAHRRQPQPPRGSFGLGRAPTPTSLGRLAEPPSW